MPPRKPRASTVAKAQEGLAAFLAMAGVNTKELNLEEEFATNDRDYIPREHHETKTLQAEGVLLIAESAAKALMHKKCKRCGEIFMTRYRGVAYCSDLCRGKEMESRIGIRWNYATDHYVAIDVDRPLIVGPAAYQTLLEMAQRIVDGHQVILQEEQKPEVPQQSYEAPTILDPEPLELDDPPIQETPLLDDPFGF